MKSFVKNMKTVCNFDLLIKQLSSEFLSSVFTFRNIVKKQNKPVTVLLSPGFTQQSPSMTSALDFWVCVLLRVIFGLNFALLSFPQSRKT